MKIVIAVAYHKTSLILKHTYLLPIQLGKNLTDCDLGIAVDNSGFNISNCNPLYCELTGIYWLWKNVDADYKGLYHYRRCFARIPYFKIKKYLKIIVQHVNKILMLFGIKDDAIITLKYNYKNSKSYQKVVFDFCDHMDSMLSDGTNIIAPCPIQFLSRKVKTHFSYIGGLYLKPLDGIVKKNYPHIYPYYRKTLDGHSVYYGNMSIMDSQTFNEYCEFLFSVLSAHEERMINDHILLDLYKEKAYSRVPAYMGELLTSAFIFYCKDKMKVKEAPVAFLDE